MVTHFEINAFYSNAKPSGDVLIMVLLILGDRNLHNELQQLPSSQPANRFRPREQGNKYLFFKCVEQ